MKSILLWTVTCGLLSLVAQAAEPAPPASERFAATDASETPDLRRHVLPLMGRLGCNGRACHGSFQGRGGFRLSLFGYDFAADHAALMGGDEPRVNVKQPSQSPILRKPTMLEEHEGGERMKVDTWQYRLLQRWVEGGAKPHVAESAEFSRLEVTPSELVFTKPGETVQLKVVAHWADGTSEIVTPICRFRTNDESIAKIDEAGLVTCQGKGDSHVVAFYDNGVQPVPVLLPISELAGAKYPSIKSATPIDQRVNEKLAKLGVVPAELCTDGEFLRRAALDITGGLPTPTEVQAFVADAAPDKRAKKVEELMNRPAYVAWWTTRLCDYTGDNDRLLRQGQVNGDVAAQQWYAWISQRVQQNMPYDKLVEGIVLAKSRRPGQSYDDYCKDTTECYLDGSCDKFAAREDMPHYWARTNFRKPEDMALGFAYSFLGVRLQCAQCHKHPFDQWTKQDFDQFTGFFKNVNLGIAADGREVGKKMQEEIKKLGNKQLKASLPELIKAGGMPWPEVFVGAGQAAKIKGDKGADRKKEPVETAKLLGAETIDLKKTSDPRQPLMDWMRKDANRYLARAFVNRVWSNYFNVGIVEPVDDMNLANPPSNLPLLDYLTGAFIEHGFDMKWLHREIVLSDTYQRSCQTNDTNALDARNFSHAVPRRLPAEVAYNAVLQATAAPDEIARLQRETGDLASGPTFGIQGRNGKGNRANYILTVFGKPTRLTNCDCERSTEASLLQTLYLRNDQEMSNLLQRQDGWLRHVTKTFKPAAEAADPRGKKEREIAATEKQLNEVLEKKNEGKVDKIQGRLTQLRRDLAWLAVEEQVGKSVGPPPSEGDLIREAYLRTVNRLPSDEEVQRNQAYLADSSDKSTGIRDILWALLNTKEFILNH